MKCEKTFEVLGKYGAHTGPAAKIVQSLWEYYDQFEDYGDTLKVEIIKRSCPHNINVGMKADASNVYEILMLINIEGGKLEVIAEHPYENENTKRTLKKIVRDIGKIITNVDRYTFRKHD